MQLAEILAAPPLEVFDSFPYTQPQVELEVWAELGNKRSFMKVYI